MVVRKSDLFIEKRQDEQVAKFVNLTELKKNFNEADHDCYEFV